MACGMWCPVVCYWKCNDISKDPAASIIRILVVALNAVRTLNLYETIGVCLQFVL